MQISEETISEHNLAKLDAYAASCSPCQFLQGSAWLKFQERVGHKPHLFCFETGERKIYFSAFEHILPLNKVYYYIPRGPLINDAKLWPEFLKEFKKTLKGKNIIFIRFEPDNSFDSNLARRVIDVQPSHSFHTELEPEEKQIFTAMHPKTRYNIRLAMKKNLAFSPNDQDFEGFVKLMNETSQRDGFKSHPSEYYKQMIASGAARLATVRYENELLAAGIFATCGDMMTYLHGASSSAKRELMAPYALHWEMMMLAKGLNLKHYDWHGVDSLKWPGVTRFKRGFGGHEFIYPGSFDFILEASSYIGYTVVRRLRRLF
jgi:lipid II:glycine glycyltransferase (peptidoglycan interpeptide bridge formation enzyme)